MDTEDAVLRWIAQVDSAVHAAVGAERGAALRAAWQERAGQQTVYVTVYGPYNAGKSSLIRRLLIEDGSDMPDWLLVSGKPQTTECAVVNSAGMAYVDTPGIGAGDADHDALADRATDLADALLVVVPPQLVTGEREQLFSVLRSCAAFDVPIRIIIAQCDLLMVDPTDDEAGFRDLLARKCIELRTLLAAGGIEAPPESILPVVADPDGLTCVVDRHDPGHFAEARAWDGIEALRTALAGLATDRSILRNRSGLRYWSVVAARASAELDQQVAQLGAGADEADRRRQQVALYERELTELDAKATDDLFTSIDQELRSAAHSARATAVESVRPEVERRLGALLGRWHLEWAMKLDAFATRAEIELAAQVERPAATAYQAGLDALLAAFGDTGQTWLQSAPVDEIAGRLKSTASLAVDRYVWEQLGMPPEVAKFEVQRAQKLAADQWEAYRNTGGLFRDAEHVDRVSRTIEDTDIIATIVPGLVELGTMLVQHVHTGLVDARERGRRRRVEETIGRSAQEITEQVRVGAASDTGPNWSDTVDSVRAALHGSAPTEAVVSIMRGQQEDLRRRRDALHNLAANRPDSR